MTMRLSCNLAKDHSGELCETTRECDKRKNNKAISIQLRKLLILACDNWPGSYSQVTVKY